MKICVSIAAALVLMGLLLATVGAVLLSCFELALHKHVYPSLRHAAAQKWRQG